MKRYFTFLQSYTICFFILFAACKKTPVSPTVPSSGNPDIDALLNTNAPAGFNYNTSREVQIDITLLSPNNLPLPHIPVNILDKSQQSGGKILFTSLTNTNGKVKGVLKLPAYYTKVVVDPNYIGIIRNATVNIIGNTISCTLGGSNTYEGNVDPNGVQTQQLFISTLDEPSVKYEYMGKFNNDGKPNYFEEPDDKISEKLLSFINASLPDGKSVAIYHPDYLSEKAETNINVTKSSDIFFTFVHEGADWKNSIAYFTYKTGSPPQSVEDIDALHIILPNASLLGSGGALKTGNKVKLGTFSPGTSIGFALIANGWNGTDVTTNAHINYTVDKLNSESNANLKRHSVSLYDNENDLFLIGMEDLMRDEGSDDDFNDCVFYITSNPAKAISSGNVVSIDSKPTDTDGDGVNDTNDLFPTDPSRAYINYYPGVNTFGTLAFEDNWPNTGDYDLNDLVINYRYTLINDAQNRTVEMKADYVVQAAGASFRNGFGVEFPFASSAVKSVEGSQLKNNTVVTLGSNGCEVGQTNAVIVAFDDAFALNPATSGAFFINTKPANPYFAFDTIKMKITFNSPIASSSIGTAPYNPFLISNKTRGREVHLPGYLPTQKANTTLFGTGNDNTSPSKSIYYKTIENLPYALAFTEKFNYLIEESSINTAYLKFIAWAQSGGTTFTDWYTNSVYIDQKYIYKK